LRGEPADAATPFLIAYFSVSTQDIPERGFPANSAQTGAFPEGEYVLTAAVRPDRNGNWQVTVAGPQFSSSFGIAADHSGWLTDSAGWSTEQAGSAATEVFDPGQPITLLRLRTMKKTSPTSSSSTPEPCDGVLLWLKKH
jgi:hypothetical protein